MSWISAAWSLVSGTSPDEKKTMNLFDECNQTTLSKSMEKYGSCIEIFHDAYDIL